MIDSSNQTRIKFNEGETLLHLANMYPRLQDVIMELVQNALDKDVNATRIWITVNYRDHYLSVKDNGAGTSIVKFHNALASVSERKRKGAGSLGEFGIGLISPLGKCKCFRFISCPAPHKALYHEWNFDTEHIRSQAENLFIPNRPRNDLIFEEKILGKKTCDWRSEMILEKFTDDSFVSHVSVDSIIGGTRDRYNTVMLRNKVKISIRLIHVDGKEERREDITAIEFHGRKLMERELVDANMGKVLFKMFVAPKTKKGRNGKVLMGVMGNDFRFPFHYLAQSAAKLLGEEVVTTLSSGLFEGEILSERARLHANRNTFEKDDFYIGLCVSIEEWFDKYGRQHMEEARQNRQDERNQELGKRSMGVIEAILQIPAHAPLLEVIKSFTSGNVGKGHTEVADKKPLGQTDQKFISADRSPGTSVQKDGDEKPRDRSEPVTAIPGHTPLTVAGPKGERRRLVRGHSMGLAFSYEPMEGSPDLWKLDTKMGVLHFNIRHPLWIVCDEKSDLSLMKLQEHVTIQALTLQIMPEPTRTYQRQVLDELNHSLVSWILGSDRARGTVPTKKSSKDKKVISE